MALLGFEVLTKMTLSFLMLPSLLSGKISFANRISLITEVGKSGFALFVP